MVSVSILTSQRISDLPQTPRGTALGSTTSNSLYVTLPSPELVLTQAFPGQLPYKPCWQVFPLRIAHTVSLPVSPANFLRDGSMAFNNQGSRPNFHSTQDPINLPTRYYNDDNHTTWVGGAVKFVSQPSEIDFDQARGFVRILSIPAEYLLTCVIFSGVGCRSATKTTSSPTSYHT